MTEYMEAAAALVTPLAFIAGAITVFVIIALAVVETALDAIFSRFL